VRRYGIDVRNSGGWQASVACSNAYTYPISRPSVQAAPTIDRPTGRPWTAPIGIVRCGYPATAGGVCRIRQSRTGFRFNRPFLANVRYFVGRMRFAECKQVRRRRGTDAHSGGPTAVAGRNKRPGYFFGATVLVSATQNAGLSG
jgi:hypothetical protein